jgi:hypothetical protein
MWWLALAVSACTWSSDPASSTAAASIEPGTRARTPKVHTKTILSQPYTIDRKYGSMRGPYGFDDVVLSESDTPELLWIVGYRTTVVDAATNAVLSQEFMCHANLDVEPASYIERFPTAPPLSGRIFTLSQGQQEIRFPEGFGIPITSDLPISLVTQVLNLNIEEPHDLKVRHRVEIEFVRDTEVVGGEMIPLFQGAVEGFKALGEARFYGFHEDEVEGEEMGAGCAPGAPAVPGETDDDPFGQQFTAHWVVPPGREVNVTNVTRFLGLPYDTTVHYIAVHLHPYAVSLALRDATTNETLFEADVTAPVGRIGIEHIEHFEHVEGLPLHVGHQYELVSTYENTSTEDADSMAVMYMYMKDRRFQRPSLTPRPVTERSAPAEPPHM